MSEYKTISQVAEQFEVSPSVLRYWEGEFRQIKPTKRKNGRRVYSEADIAEIARVKTLLHIKGYTIKGAKQVLQAQNQGFMPKNLADNENQIGLFEELSPVLEETGASSKRKLVKI